MDPVADNIWDVSAPLKLGLVDLEHRMTVVRLASGSLWIHSPIALTPDLRRTLAELGPVEHIVAPSVFHDLYVPMWTRAYPEAQLHTAPGVQQEHTDWTVTDEMSLETPPAWGDELHGLVLGGMPKVNETVFVHGPSGTLIVADLVFNMTDWPMNTVSALTFRLFGTYQKLAASRLFRSLIKDRGAMRAALDRMLGWDFDRVLVGHGHRIESGGREAIREAWSFLKG